MRLRNLVLSLVISLLGIANCFAGGSDYGNRSRQNQVVQ